MPLYEYTCPKCNKTFELLRSLEERDLACKCPHCGAKQRMDRLSSRVSSTTRSKDAGSQSSCGPSGSPFT